MKFLKEKAKDFAIKLGIQMFFLASSSGQRVLKSDMAAFKKAARVNKSVDKGVHNRWTEDLPTLLEWYDPDNTYNVDKACLFFKCLPDKTSKFNGEECHRGK